MSLFGWSLPPGCGTLPGEEEEQPIQLHEDKTLKGYGRRGHGLNGKDADLDYGGQLVIKEAWWFVDGTIKVSARGYASLVPAEVYDFEHYALKENPSLEGRQLEARCDQMHSEYMDYCHEVVCGDGWEGEWDGDYWVLGHDINLDLNLDWNDDLTEEQNIEVALRKVYVVVGVANAKFEHEMTQAAKSMNLDNYFKETE